MGNLKVVVHPTNHCVQIAQTLFDMIQYYQHFIRDPFKDNALISKKYVLHVKDVFQLPSKRNVGALSKLTFAKMYFTIQFIQYKKLVHVPRVVRIQNCIMFQIEISMAIELRYDLFFNYFEYFSKC